MATRSGLIWHSRSHPMSGVYTVARVKVGAGPEPRRVDAQEFFGNRIELKHRHKEVPYPPRVAKTLHAQCPIIQ
jgi:hypothetical protein